MAQHYGPRSPYYSNIKKDGLVLWLDPADKTSYPRSGTVWTDMSGEGNHGTLVNGPGFSSEAGGSITYDGSNDYVTVPDSSDFAFGTGDFAIEQWLKFDTIGSIGNDVWWSTLQWNGGETYRTGIFLFYKGTSPAGDFEWRTECNWTGHTAGRGFYPAIITLIDASNSGNNKITDDTWHLFTVSRQSEAVFKKYIDGVLIETITTADGAANPRGLTYETTWPDMNQILYVGGYSAQYTDGHKGPMGPVRVYKGTSLSDAEVLYNFTIERGRFGV